MAFLLGMLAALLVILALFCEAEGWRLYRIERGWRLIEQQEALTGFSEFAETAHSAL